MPADIRTWYDAPWRVKLSRRPCWVFPKQIFEADALFQVTTKRIPEWYGAKGVPLLLTWATKDVAFHNSELKVFQDWFTNVQVVRPVPGRSGFPKA